MWNRSVAVWAGAAIAAVTLSAVALAQSPLPDPSDTVVRDGEEWIAYQWSYPEPGIYLIRPDGTGHHRLAGDLGGEQLMPTWSPDGRRIAFTNRDRA